LSARLGVTVDLMGASDIELHFFGRAGWLRAAVLGANDGIISTSSLIVGVAATDSSFRAVLTAGVAGLISGSMAMAAGEYVSVHAQSDTEAADLARERQELRDQPAAELEELAQIYVSRGLEVELAHRVAEQLMQSDALGAHARDELGISELTAARPLQAALASWASFAVGAALPIAALCVVPTRWLVLGVSSLSVASLALLGVLGARAGGATPLRPALRIAFWGALAMAVTAVVGALLGKVV
jgi:VIT1/CCC1 family predicted Fe2+/Mn2+ transporter